VEARLWALVLARGGLADAKASEVNAKASEVLAPAPLFARAVGPLHRYGGKTPVFPAPCAPQSHLQVAKP
jgi:hypothetical protein